MLKFADIDWYTDYKTAGLNVQYKIQHFGNTCRIFFQPSSDIRLQPIDWLLNFSAWVLPYKNMGKKWYAHAGYVKAYKSIKDQLYKDMNAWPFDRIEIYGYSLGGALATLCHEDMVFHFGECVSTYAYGSPRVIFWPNDEVRQRFAYLFRIADKRDLVTKVPFFPFFHVGQLVSIGKPGLPSLKGHYPDKYIGW